MGFAVPVETFFPPFVVRVPLRFLMCLGTFHQGPYFVLAVVYLDYCLLLIIQYLGIGMLEAVPMARCLTLFFFHPLDVHCMFYLFEYHVHVGSLLWKDILMCSKW
jgi:hypothetical protein